MPSIQKEIAGLMATSLSPLALPNLHDILNNERTTALSPMALRDTLVESQPLIRHGAFGYELFHPYFEEYVRSVAAGEKVDGYYHSLLAEHWLKMKQPVATAYHMIRSNDPRVRDHLAAGATSAIFQGNWPIAEEITQRQLDLAVQDHDEHEEAYSRYLLGQVYLERGKHALAHAEADASVQLFDKLGEKEWSETVRLWSSLILVEEGRAAEALAILESALLHYRKRDPRLEAFIQLYCAHVYSKLSRFSDGAKAAQRAMRLFKKMDDEQGVYVSLSNLSLCVGELGDRKLQEKYARQIIDAAERLDLPRMKASGLNQLAIALRKKDDSEGARMALREAISIAQQVGSVDTEAMNIANLGNAFHDDKMDTEAEAAYLESLTKAREHGLLRQQGHALQVLARLRHDQNRDEEAVEFGKQSLSIYTSLGEVVKMAAVQSYLARSLLRLDLLNEAAEHYQQAADNYERIGQFDDASYDYQQAATLWYRLGMQENALFCVERGVESAFHYGNPVRAAEVLADVPDDVHRTKTGEMYLDTLQQFASGKTARPFVETMINFAIHCKRNQDAELFQNGLKVITESLANTVRPEVLYALAQAVEQAGNGLMTMESLYKMASSIAKDVDHLHFRHMPGQTSIWTIGMAWDRPLVAQVITYSDGITSNRVAMALALMIRAGSDLIGKAVSSYGGNLETGFELDVVTHSEIAEAGINIDVDMDGPPASVTASAVPYGQPQPPTVLVLHDDYDTDSDWAANPGTKAFVWVLMITHSAVVAHSVHGNRDELKGLSRKSRRFCEIALK